MDVPVLVNEVMTKIAIVVGSNVGEVMSPVINWPMTVALLMNLVGTVIPVDSVKFGSKSAARVFVAFRGVVM